MIFINPNISEAGKMTRFNSDTARIAGRKGGKTKAKKEKHNGKTADNDDDNVLLFIESMRRSEEKQR